MSLLKVVRASFAAMMIAAASLTATVPTAAQAQAASAPEAAAAPKAAAVAEEAVAGAPPRRAICSRWPASMSCVPIAPSATTTREASASRRASTRAADADDDVCEAMDVLPGVRRLSARRERLRG